MLTDLAMLRHSCISPAVCRHAQNVSSSSAGSEADQQVSHPHFSTEIDGVCHSNFFSELFKTESLAAWAKALEKSTGNTEKY